MLAVSQVQTDWNSGHYAKVQNGGNPVCPTGHTKEYCYGYVGGYKYEWTTTWLEQLHPYQYGHGLCKSDGLANYMSLDDSCSMCGPHVNGTAPLQEDQCIKGYDTAYNIYCHIGVIKHPQPDDEAAPCLVHQRGPLPTWMNAVCIPS